MIRWVVKCLMALLIMRALFPMALGDPRMVAWMVTGITSACIAYSIVSIGEWLYLKVRKRS